MQETNEEIKDLKIIENISILLLLKILLKENKLNFVAILILSVV